jgi:hypothetical protein
MESRLEGDIDLQGFLGIKDDVPRGYKEIRMYVNIDADAPPEKLEEIVQLGPSTRLHGLYRYRFNSKANPGFMSSGRLFVELAGRHKRINR